MKHTAMHEKRLTNCQQALGNFDAFYKPFYREDWPSIRVSLLSLPKHCAAVNKYGLLEKTQEQLFDMGASDFLLNTDLSFQNKAVLEPMQRISEENEAGAGEVMATDNVFFPNEESVGEYDESFADDENLNDDLHVFVPTEKVYSEKDLLLKEEMSLNSFESRDVSLEVLPAEAQCIPPDLRTFVFPEGVVSKFPSPRPHHGILGYYLMDAASVLPVLALDVQPEDRVLDLCAAPGGKSYLMLQVLNLFEGGRLHCNDSAQARLARLKSVLSLHFPQDIVEQVTVTKMDGTSAFPTAYNKVLVDVPCNADRHVVTEEDNNLFKVSRTRERLGLTGLQKDLLISAIKSCIPGGTVVYSTCTLSPAQNDGVIQAAAEELWETSEVEFAVQDLSPLYHALGHIFKFHNNRRHGLTVLPTLLNNFGPSYVAKLRRIK